MDPDAGQQILSTLQNYDTDLEKDLRSRLFTMDDVQNADDKFIQKILHSMSDTDIAYLICDKTELFRKKIFTNISKTRGASVLEEESARKPVRKKDVNAVTDSFLKKLRTAWESGELIIAARDEDQWVE
jgi:flagellar motor switch protein FliG